METGLKPTETIPNRKSCFNDVTRHKFTIVSGHKFEGDPTEKANYPIKVLTNEEPLYKRMPDGKFLPVVQPKLSPPILPSPPKPEALNANHTGTEDWDGWPDGNFEQDFTFQEFEQAGNLTVHWATTVNGGDRKGDKDALVWERGKRSMRKCLGVIECDNPICTIITHPQTTSQWIANQLGKSCKCGSVLSRQRCEVVSHLWKWSGGIHYLNQGFHVHCRPTHLLHLHANEQQEFIELVKANPKSGPLQLIVGVPGLEGPGKSAADISDVLLNADRVSKERQKVKRGKVQSADGLIAAFSKFALERLNFVIHSHLGEQTVICLQTPFMRSQLVKNSHLEGAINRTVNDAAHGWWKEHNSLLMVSLTYCPDLLCWVPGVLSYMNGASSAHFEHHFLAVFQSIAHEAESHNIVVVDEIFAGVYNLTFILAALTDCCIFRLWISVKLSAVGLSVVS